MVKKWLSLLLALMLCLSLAACGGGGAESFDDGAAVSEGEAETDAEDQPDQPSNGLIPNEPAVPTVRLGETISLDCADLTLDALVISDGFDFSYTEASSGIRVTYRANIDCASGMKLICLLGKFTNKTSSSVYPVNDPVRGKIVVNGYEYDTRMECCSGEAQSLLDLVSMREADCYIYAEVPEKLTDEIESCALHLGFVKNMDPYVWISDMKECDALHLLEAMPEVE